MNQRDFKISIITISYNSEKFITDTIQSVTSQTYSNIEYIIIDGGSVDGTIDIIKKFESKISKWISEPDKGIADAFNKGCNFSTGEYILILNSDDALSNCNVVEKMVAEIYLNNLPKLIYGNYDIFKREKAELLYHGKVEFDPSKLKQGLVLPQPTLFVHQSYFKKYGNFDISFKIAMDYEWLLRGIMKETVVHVPWVVTNIRDGGISTVNQKKVINEIIRALKKNNFFPNLFSEFKTISYFYLRYFSKKTLEKMGLYKIFFTLRTRLKKCII